MGADTLDWANVRKQVQEGDQFATWSNTGRARAIRFKITAITERGFEIERLKDGSRYKIYKQSIDAIGQVWSDYLADRFPRTEMRRFSFASSYVLGIFAKLTGRE